jgi:hypothetical protein
MIRYIRDIYTVHSRTPHTHHQQPIFKHSTMDFGLQGKIAFVTGSSTGTLVRQLSLFTLRPNRLSPGIGKDSAILFGKYGAKVAITYHSDKAGAEATAETVKSNGSEVRTHRLSGETLDLTLTQRNPGNRSAVRPRGPRVHRGSRGSGCGQVGSDRRLRC